MAGVEYSMESGQQSERSVNPREAAFKFTNYLNEIKTVSANGNLDRSKLDRLRSILEFAPVTKDFKKQIINRVGRAIETKLINSVDPDYFLDDLEIDIENDRFGIFDSNEAKEIERRIINMEKNTPHLAPKLAHDEEEKLRHWKESFQHFYNENPFK